MATPKQERIEIPTTTEGDVVDIDLSEISPENRADVDSIREVLLSAEVAIRDKPGLFLDFAVGLTRSGMERRRVGQFDSHHSLLSTAGILQAWHVSRL